MARFLHTCIRDLNAFVDVLLNGELPHDFQLRFGTESVGIAFLEICSCARFVSVLSNFTNETFLCRYPPMAAAA